VKRATLSANLEAALEEFRNGEGVVEYFVFEADIEAGLRQSVSGLPLHEAAMREVLRRLEQRAQPKHFPTAPHRMISQEVTLESFLTAISGNDLARYKVGVIDDTDGSFRLQRMPEGTRTRFDTINSLLFASFKDNLEIMRWSEGFLEWWGAFWWTVHNRTRNLVVVITASATD
jgi:hypothetical protein